MSGADSIESVYDALLNNIITLRQFKGTFENQGEDVTVRSFQSLNSFEKLSFANKCTVELNSTYLFVYDFLVRNKDIIVDYIRSIKSLINVSSELNKPNELKRNLLGILSEGIFEEVLENLQAIIKEVISIIQMADLGLEVDKWFDMLYDLGKRLKECSPLYVSIETPIEETEEQIKAAIREQGQKINHLREVIMYTWGETEFFPGDEGFAPDIFGRPYNEVEKHLRDLHNRNMEKISCSVEHLRIVMRSLKEQLVKLDKFHALLFDVKLFNTLFSKFRKTRLFDILCNFQALINNYEKLSENNYEN